MEVLATADVAYRCLLPFESRDSRTHPPKKRSLYRTNFNAGHTSVPKREKHGFFWQNLTDLEGASKKFNQGAAVSPEANMGSTARMKVQKFCFNERVGWFRFSADFSSYECERKRVHVRDLCIVPFRVLVCMS